MRAGQGAWSSGAPCRSSSTALARAFCAAMARATGSMSWATTRVAPASRAAMPATPLPQPRSSTVCPRTQAGSACTTRASSWPAGRDGRPEGDRLRRPALLLPRLPQGHHVRGVMGHEVGRPGTGVSGASRASSADEGTGTGRSAAGVMAQPVSGCERPIARPSAARPTTCAMTRGAWWMPGSEAVTCDVPACVSRRSPRVAPAVSPRETLVHGQG